MAFRLFIFGRIFRPCALAAAALALFASGTACADQPFRLDQTGWMSLDRYNHHPSAWHAPKTSAPAPAATPEIHAPSLTPVYINPPMPAEIAQGAALPPVIVPLPVALPVLQQPLQTPAMPGIGTGSQIPPALSAAATGAASNPDGRLPFGPPDRAWETAAQAARRIAARKPAPAKKSGAPDIRFANLPNPNILPAFDLPHTPVPPRMTETKMAKAQTQAQSPQDQAACAAIDAYKKQQLAAIESDRRTLTALQNAIAQLGLSKQLGYLVDDKGNAIATAGNVKMNFPAKAPASVKN